MRRSFARLRSSTSASPILSKQSTVTAAGKKYFLVHDPAIAIAHLLDEGAADQKDLFEINELLGAFQHAK